MQTVTGCGKLAQNMYMMKTITNEYTIAQGNANILSIMTFAHIIFDYPYFDVALCMNMLNTNKYK